MKKKECKVSSFLCRLFFFIFNEKISWRHIRISEKKNHLVVAGLAAPSYILLLLIKNKKVRFLFDFIKLVFLLFLFFGMFSSFDLIYLFIIHIYFIPNITKTYRNILQCLKGWLVWLIFKLVSGSFFWWPMHSCVSLRKYTTD